MNTRTLAIALASAAAAAAFTAAVQNHPATAQTGYGFTNGGTVTLSAATPGSGGTSHAWAIDQRTNSVTFCRGDGAGRISCTQTLLPGAAASPR